MSAAPDWLVKLQAEAARRFEAVDWQQGKWYAIYDERDGDAGPQSAQMYKCEIDAEGEVYLIEDMCDYDRRGGHQPDCFEARDFITSGSVVTPL